MPRALVDRKAHPWPSTVTEVLRVARGVDDRAGDGVDLAPGGARPHRLERRLLGAQDDLVDLRVARVELPVAKVRVQSEA
jgi:hypothetical protein